MPITTEVDRKIWRLASRLTRGGLTVDAHSDVTYRLFEEGFDFCARHQSGHLDLPRMKEGGLWAEFFAIYTPPEIRGEDAVKRARMSLDAIHSLVDGHPDELVLAVHAEDVVRARESCRISVLVGLENGNPIPEGRLDLLREYVQWGVRYVGLCHWAHNELCDSSGESEPRWGGLSPWGRAFVAEMGRMGVMVDVSHARDETVWDVLKITDHPIIASHSCARALNGIARNLPDSLVHAIAERGGVVNVNFYAGFLCPSFERAEAARRIRHREEFDRIREECGPDHTRLVARMAEIYVRDPVPEPGVELLADHIEHLVGIAGVDHVGIGSDFDGISTLPVPMRGCQDLPWIPYLLLQRGHRPQDVRKIMGGNLLRVLGQVSGK